MILASRQSTLATAAMRRAVAGACAILATVALCACGESTDTAANAPPAAADTQASVSPNTQASTPRTQQQPRQDAAPEPANVPDGWDTPAITYNWDTEDGNGYTLAGELNMGGPVRLDDYPGIAHPSDPSLVAGSACNINPQTDAVVPLWITLTQTTSGFDAPVQQSFGQMGYYSAVESSGHCRESGQSVSNGAFLISSNEEPLAEGETVNFNAFLVIRDYYSPDYPDGDTSRLDESGFTLPGVPYADITSPDTESVAGQLTVSGNH